MGEELQTGKIENRRGPEVANQATQVQQVTARGPVVGAAVGGALATVGGALLAVPFPYPWIGPVVGAVLIGVGTVIAAVNGVQLDVSKLTPKPPPESK